MTYDRWFLLGEKRNELLARWEVEQYGRDNFGDPDYIAIYGLAPREWYARGVRILGRTAVECTRDRLADRIGRDVAAIAGSASSVVVDLFAGSANTLHWIARQTGARRAIGFELDDAVFALTRANLSAMGLDIDLRHDSYEHGLTALGDPDADLLIVFVAPPGAAPSTLSPGSTCAAPSPRWRTSSIPPRAFSADTSCCSRSRSTRPSTPPRSPN
jgi:hypothetical protein